MMLDLESVRLFALAAEYGNLTRAAEAAGTVQPVVSQRIKGLEKALGRKLLDRSPRFVRLTPAGAAFLDRARTLLAAHDAALATDEPTPARVTIGVSDHVLGTAFDGVFRRLRQALPGHAALSVRLGFSAQVRDAYETGAIDLALIRRESGADDGEVLGEDPLDWRGEGAWRPADGPVPLVLLPSPCAVRAVAQRRLDDAGIAWRESFVGGSCLALAAAVRAGLGVAPLGRLIGDGLPALGPDSGLPALPASQVVLLARTTNPVEGAAARVLAASVRDLLR